MTNELVPVDGEIVEKWQLTKPTPPGTKMTPLVVASILENLEQGNYIEQSCQAAGINRRTLARWLEKGEAEPDSVFGEFADLVETARAHAEADNVRIIKRAASSNWTAAAWLLERQYPQRWGRREHVHQTGDIAHRVQFVFADVKALEDGDGDEDGND